MIQEKDLKKIIRTQILKQAAEDLRSKKVSYTKDSYRDKDFDSIFFNGGFDDDGFNKTLNLNENEMVKIGISEIKQFEDEFNQVVNKYPNTTITFDVQNEKSKSLLFKKDQNGVMILASGVINCGNNGSFRWVFSMPNGLKISTENFEITQENKDIISEIYLYYYEWEKKWRTRLMSNNTLPTEMGENPNPDQPAPNM